MIIKVKMYELLETLINLDNEIINKAITNRSFIDLVMVSQRLVLTVCVGRLWKVQQ